MKMSTTLAATILTFRPYQHERLRMMFHRHGRAEEFRRVEIFAEVIRQEYEDHLDAQVSNRTKAGVS